MSTGREGLLGGADTGFDRQARATETRVREVPGEGSPTAGAQKESIPPQVHPKGGTHVLQGKEGEEEGKGQPGR